MPDVIPETNLGADVVDLLQGVTHRIRRAARHQLEPLGVTWGQVRALRAVARDSRAVRMSDLADRLQIARRSATSVVDELVGRGLVARVADPTDRRAVAVELTPAGRALLGEVDDNRRSVAERLTSTLTAPELRTLRDLLRRLDRD
jgi:DNA-binding MarR family transcriptional regulator